ncbi:hypothetical protein A8U91_01211 [Halomonas elongata]|nr:hypothetical protein A8U91_01211 [Halomonas elongata]
MLQFWLGPEGFGPYLAKFRSGTDQEAANTASADETEGA